MAPPRVFPEEVLLDLVAEHEDLDRVLSSLDLRQWVEPTPCEGWAVRDQVSHLAFFDDAAVMALVDPVGFAETARSATEREGDPMEEHLRRGREMSPPSLLEWWRTSRATLAESARGRPRDERVPWFGPPMSLTSFVSARLMETWAHGQDVADALGVTRTPTDRLRHVAHLGVRARPFSYLVRGLAVPDGPEGAVRVELSSPSGGTWVWEGEPTNGAPQGSVTGSAEDFCLVVTQRRNLDDTSLEVRGRAALEWMRIAQAFAGPPGPGRPPEAKGERGRAEPLPVHRTERRG